VTYITVSGFIYSAEDVSKHEHFCFFRFTKFLGYIFGHQVSNV